MPRLFRNIGWLLGSRGVNALFSLVYLALATRTLGLDDFGRFSLIVVLAQAVTGFATFQTWQAVVRWGTAEREVDDALGFALALDALSVVCGTVIAALVCWSAPLWLPLPPDLRLPAFALCLAALLAIRSTPTGLLRLHDRYGKAALAETALPATRAAGAGIAALFAPGIAGFVAVWALAEIACAAAFWIIALRVHGKRVPLPSLTRLPARHADAWRFVWATNLSRSLAVTAKQVLLLLVGALGGAALAGGYRVASQLGQALVQLAEAVGRALYPELVRAGGEAAAITARMARLSLLTGALAVGFAWLLGGVALVWLAGPGFGFAHGAMVILALAGAAELFAANWDALLVSQARAGLAFAIRAVPLGLALAAMPGAMAAWGLEGVALCVLAASALTAAGFAYVVGARPGMRGAMR
ncbi:hypothetical protein B2G71_03690 [Novosphingobium sp. PC22D]|uniref:lipopolysaccharide biosynthesis protein n=1 Tax=Novosphingobium sp. PC22D TaxID=1962403 RepID=UPI000BFAC0D7|nr:lipopolysaccharide biosynthesis protein [Novosphingobium sp. PC22D]PEQ14666.1 hypothetical protein B2G71_03690 [Novosphingobium sp. PC22D]